MNHRQHPADARDADILTDNERFTLLVLGCCIILFGVFAGAMALMAVWEL